MRLCFLTTLPSGLKLLLHLTNELRLWPNCLLSKLCVGMHGLQEDLLSDRGANFLSILVQEICKVLGVKNINTSGYHPQIDGLVERFNSTVTDMIAKSCDIKERDWNDQLPFLLFTYRVSAQESTKESPFFLTHGSDPCLPTETLLTFDKSSYAIDTDDYKIDLCSSLFAA